MCYSEKFEAMGSGKLFIVVIFVLASIISSNLNAQVINAGVSPYGVILHYEGELNDIPIKILKDGKNLGELKLQTREEEVRKALKEAEKFFYTHPQLDDSVVKHFHQTLINAKTTEQIYSKYLITVKKAIGLALVDPKGKPESIYTAMQGDEAITVNWDRKNAEFKEPAISPRHHRSWYGNIETTWSLNPSNTLLYVKLFRKNNDSLRYHLVESPVVNNTMRGDTAIVVAMDTSLKKLSYYHYQMAGYDFYGNPTRLSKMMVADNLDNSTLPSIYHFTAEENEAKTQVTIKWKINFHERVKSALLFRSIRSDRDFQLVTQLPPADSVYFDEIVNPMEAVFYKIVLYDLKGMLNHAPVVPMVSKQKPDATPPSDVNVVLDKGKPLISWSIKDQTARGFYVYRTDAVGKEPILVSSFIDADTSIHYQWKDTSRYLKEGVVYHYAVMSDSRGYVKSDFSDFASIEIVHQNPPQTPSNVLARMMDTDKVLIVWNPYEQDISTPQIFNVYRALKEDASFERINKLPLFAENAYLDTLPSKASEFYYRVTSIDGQGRESAMSPTCRVITRLVPWGIRNIRINELSEGVEISWPVGDPEVHEVEIIRIDETDKTEVIAKQANNGGIFMDKNTRKGKQYTYQVVSIGQKGERSEPSESVSIAR